MDKPVRHRNHVLETKSENFFNRFVPVEWVKTNLLKDYGVDLLIDIVLNEQVTGLNFSVQMKSTERTVDPDLAKVSLKRSTLNYYKVRLEPTMLVMYDSAADEAYWSWVANFNIDYSKLSKTCTLSIPKSNKLSELSWDEIVSYVQHIFNAKSFISDFDIKEIDSITELDAWKVYYKGDHHQAIYLFRRLIQTGNGKYNVHQALAWSLYQTFQYKDALNIINYLLDIDKNDDCQKTKACILTEYGQQDKDKGKIIQARNLFQKFLSGKDSALMIYNYANTFYALGSYSEALEQYKLSIERDPLNAQCWKNMGTTYYHLGEHDKELECYDHALEISSDLPQALFSKGVTLAQHYAKYSEALQLFHRVLDHRNDLIHQYVSGFFWVAYCYEEVGNLPQALNWIDKGLNYDGTNLYFLDFKSNLLGRHWKTHPELKQKAIEFFQYRIELNKDQLSLYHMILIKGYNLEQAISFLKDKFSIYEQITIRQLLNLNITLEDLINTVVYVDVYLDFRQGKLLTRYVDHIISPHFSISQEFFSLLELVFIIAFSKSVDEARRNKDETAHGRIIYQTMINLMPILVDYLIPEEQFEEEVILEILVFNLQGYLDMIHREIGAQSGHIMKNMKLRIVDPDEYFTEEQQYQLSDMVFRQYYKRLIKGTGA